MDISKAIKQSDIQSHGASLLTKRLDKSPSHDNKSGHVSFSFKKNYGSRIVNTQPFIPVRREEKRASPVEIKLLKPETDVNDAVDGGIEKIENGSTTGSLEGSERDECKSEREEEKGPENKILMEDFVKVQSKDDSGRVLDWPKEMIQYSKTEPRLMYSCNPLSFDFSQLFSTKKKSPGHAGQGTSSVTLDNDSEQKGSEEIEQKSEDAQKADSEKKKSHKKKKKKHKHKKHKDKNEVKDAADDDESKKVGEETSTSSKKKKKKHKRKHEDKENDTSKENIENTELADDKEKKRHKKSKKKSKQSEEEGEKLGEDERKHSKKKKKKKSKKRKKSKHQGESENDKSDAEKESKEKEKGESGVSGKESENEKKDKESKKKKKKRKKHKRKESGKDESSDSEVEKVETGKTEVSEVSDVTAPVKRKFPEGDSDGESDKIVAKLQALSRTKVGQKPPVVNNQVLPKKIKKEPVDSTEKKTPSDRKRMNSESSVNESTTPVKKARVTPKASGIKDNVHIAAIAQIANVKVEKEESWSKIETQTTDNVKSKWDTSDSDMDNALDETLKKEKVLRKRASARGGVKKTNILKDLKSPSVKNGAKTDNEHKKIVNQNSSQRSNKSNISAGSAKLLNNINDKPVRKSRKVSRSPASSHSRSRSRSHRSYSHSGSSSRSRSRSYSSSSYYSDDSRHSRHRRRRSSSRSYSRSSSRSRSRSYHRRRGRSSSYSDYSRSRSYSSSRSRSRSHRRRKRSYTRSRSRSYSSSSYSSRSRSRTRSYRKSRRKNRRKKIFSKDRSLSAPPVEKEITTKKKSDKDEKVKEVKEKVDPSEIPLPDLSGKKDDERTEEKLQKLKEKKRRTDVGETVAKLVESLPADIPLPFSEGASRTVSSDSLPSGPPTEAPKETDSGFIGPKMPGPPPPPPHMGRGFPPNHGPPGPPRPGYMHGQWDHWDAPGPWDGPGHWDGPRPPFRGMRPPYDPRMYGPYDPRRRGPPSHYMNRPRGPHPYMGPRYPGPPGPHPEYGYEYGEYDYAEDDASKSSSPPPLPKDPPKESSPKPPLPKKKGKDQTEPEQNPDIVIPPEQAEQYKHLQKQAAKHARRQLRRQAKKELGEPDEDSTSSESEPEEQPEEVVEEAVVDDTQAQLVAVPQQVILQPQPAGSPSGAYIIVSGGQQYIVQKPHIVQAGMPIQAGQPVMVSQGAIMATAAAAAHGAHPAHVVQQVPVGHQILAAPTHQLSAGLSAGVPVHMASAASIQHLQQMQQLQQLHQIQQIQQIQQAQAIQAHNQAVAAAAVQQGPIVVGNRILVPTLGVRPGI